MRFEHLPIGHKFIWVSGSEVTCFEKKSLSSAFTLDPARNFERGKLPGFYAKDGTVRFAPAVEVFPFDWKL